MQGGDGEMRVKELHQQRCALGGRNSSVAALMGEAAARARLPDICARPHNHLRGLCYFLWLRACSPAARWHHFYPSCYDCSSPPALCLPPFLPPSNSTPSTPVSRLPADRDCLRPGLDFPVSASPPLLYRSYLDAHSSSSHSHVFRLPHNLTPPV